MDHYLRAFLEQQHPAAMQLASESDLVEVEPLGAEPFDRYRIRLRTKGLVRDGSAVREAVGCEANVWFSNAYLSIVDPFDVVTWIAPRSAFHPNIVRWHDGRMVVCLGRTAPGTPLVDLIHQINDVWTYQLFTVDEWEALDHDACAWARQRMERFPLDDRPLKRRAPAPAPGKEAR